MSRGQQLARQFMRTASRLRRPRSHYISQRDFMLLSGWIGSQSRIRYDPDLAEGFDPAVEFNRVLRVMPVQRRKTATPKIAKKVKK